MRERDRRAKREEVRDEVKFLKKEKMKRKHRYLSRGKRICFDRSYEVFGQLLKRSF